MDTTASVPFTQRIIASQAIKILFLPHFYRLLIQEVGKWQSDMHVDAARIHLFGLEAPISGIIGIVNFSRTMMLYKVIRSLHSPQFTCSYPYPFLYGFTTNVHGRTSLRIIYISLLFEAGT